MSATKLAERKNKKAREDIKRAKKKNEQEKREKVLGILLKLKEEGKPTEILGWKLDENDQLVKIPVTPELIAQWTPKASEVQALVEVMQANADPEGKVVVNP